MRRTTNAAMGFLAVTFLTAGVFLAPSRVDATLIGVAYSDTNSPVWLIDEATGAGTLIGMAGFSGLNSLARDPSGTLFSAADTFRGDNTSLITIDPATGGQGTLVATLDFGGVTPDVRGLAFSPAGVLFAVQNVGGSGSNDLYTINVTTGIGTLVGSTGIPVIQGLDFAPDGTLFAWSTGQTGVGLVTLDPATGLGTDVNPSVGSSVDVQSILFGTDGTLFGAGSSALSWIDPMTGDTTLIGSGDYVSVRGIEECVGACSTVPEPSTLLLVAVGLLVSGVAAQRRHDRS